MGQVFDYDVTLVKACSPPSEISQVLCLEDQGLFLCTKQTNIERNMYDVLCMVTFPSRILRTLPHPTFTKGIMCTSCFLWMQSRNKGCLNRPAR